MIVSTPAIVISTLRYGEADLIVKLYTLSDGLKTYMLKGVLKSRRGKLKSSFFQPLTQLQIEASHKNKGNLEYLREAKVIHTYQSLHTDVVKSAMLMFLAEVLRNAIREEESNEALFHFLEKAFQWLDMHKTIANFHLLFLLKLTRYLGFQPENTQSDLPYFNLLEGNFQEISTNNYCIEGKNLNILRAFLGIHFDDLTQIKLNQKNRNGFLSMLLLYYELHVDGFKKPRSLSVFNEIFS